MAQQHSHSDPFARSLILVKSARKKKFHGRNYLALDPTSLGATLERVLGSPRCFFLQTGWFGK